MSGLWAVLPMAFVMVAGPQIISAIFIATGTRWLRNSLAYLLGALAASALATGVTYFGYGYLSRFAAPAAPAAFKVGVQWVCIALLAFLAVRTFLKRSGSEPPSWMGKLQDAGPWLAFRVAFLLYLLMPTDLVSTVTVGAHLARKGSPYWHVATFLALTLLLAAAPMILDLLLGRRAAAFLPRFRGWMNRNSWVVSEVLIVFFIAMSAEGLLESH